MGWKVHEIGNTPQTGEAALGSCQWLHVDFAPGLRAFYLDTCSFQPTEAVLLRLDREGDQSPTAAPPIRN